MPVGPGKYDDICGDLLEKHDAECVCLIIINGDKGSGISAKSLTREISYILPSLLESLAEEMRKDLSIRGAN